MFQIQAAEFLIAPNATALPHGVYSVDYLGDANGDSGRSVCRIEDLAYSQALIGICLPTSLL